MGHGHLQHSSTDVNGFGWIAWEMYRLWEHRVHTERICLALRAGSAAIGDREYASAFDMSELYNGLQGFDLHD
ncbi:hypothetical protein F2Q70_00001653 [Brassica cretica]|uniref:Uncharacterized protein n=1 Tax=Brassica cretica TaxID=69181 RepID=A0A8S9IZQ4_BRACR|nr:hypothetical protein F2Q70_00001653 [Brassica cretica]